MLHGMRDPSSPAPLLPSTPPGTRGQTYAPCSGSTEPNHWTAREFGKPFLPLAAVRTSILEIILSSPLNTPSVLPFFLFYLQFFSLYSARIGICLVSAVTMCFNLVFWPLGLY